MMKNSDRFLSAFNEIEQHLRRLTNSNRSATFSGLVERASKRSAEVRRFQVDLKEFADLRNAIVHESTDGHVIAEPNEGTVQKIEQMMALITQPPTLRGIMTRDVKMLDAGASAAEAVTFLYRHDYSQAPVYDKDAFTGLLTTDTLARWLGAVVEEDIFSLSETTLHKVMQYTEDTDHAIFLSVEESVFRVLEIFHEYEARGKRLDAVLITHSGKPSEALLGIVTVFDLTRLYQAIQIHSE